jgi:hypothetical protein
VCHIAVLSQYSKADEVMQLGESST